jgi:hypothetical protein
LKETRARAVTAGKGRTVNKHAKGLFMVASSEDSARRSGGRRRGGIDFRLYRPLLYVAATGVVAVLSRNPNACGAGTAEGPWSRRGSVGTGASPAASASAGSPGSTLTPI